MSNIVLIKEWIFRPVWCNIYGYKWEKQANTKDIFIFVITPFAIKLSIADSCKKNNTSWGCSGYILKNDNMNYLK